MKKVLEIEKINALWHNYKNTETIESRNQLIEYYSPMVRNIAEKLSFHLPGFVCVDDLVSMGLLGLFSSIKSFNLNRGVRFETFCATRVRGAMIDGLRETDWVPRLVRMKSNRLGKTYRRLENSLCRKPNEAELANELGLSLNEYCRMVSDSSATSMLHFTYKDEDDETNLSTSNLVEDNKSKDDFKGYLNAQIMNYIKNRLAKKEKLVLEMYYYEEMTMDEIGYVLDITESRVSQILANILKRLKTLLRKHKNEWLS